MYYALLDNGHGVDTKGKRSPDGLILEYKYTRELAAAIYERLSITTNIKPILITPERKDIPLATILRSPIFAFTDNDLISIRLTDRSCSFYESMIKVFSVVSGSIFVLLTKS